MNAKLNLRHKVELFAPHCPYQMYANLLVFRGRSLLLVLLKAFSFEKKQDRTLLEIKLRLHLSFEY